MRMVRGRWKTKEKKNAGFDSARLGCDLVDSPIRNTCQYCARVLWRFHDDTAEANDSTASQPRRKSTELCTVYLILLATRSPWATDGCETQITNSIFAGARSLLSDSDLASSSSSSSGCDDQIQYLSSSENKGRRQRRSNKSPLCSQDRRRE